MKQSFEFNIKKAYMSLSGKQSFQFVYIIFQGLFLTLLHFPELSLTTKPLQIALPLAWSLKLVIFHILALTTRL